MPVFKKPEVLVQRNSIVFPEFDYLQRNLMANVKALENNIRSRGMYIPNSNLLSQLLYSASEIEEGETDNAYFNRIRAMSVGMYTALGVIHEGGYGSVIHNAIYSDISEYFLAVESEFDSMSDDVGVRIISHPYVGGRVPEFTNVVTVDRLNRPKDSFAYFTIDFALLVFNYSKYVKEQRSLLKEGEELSNPIDNFLREIVYPSLVSQHMDLSFFNKLSRLITGAKFIRTKGTSDISLADYSSKTDDILDDYTDYIMSQITSIEQLLVLPLPSGKMIWDLMLEQDIKIQQTHWYYVMANGNLLSYILLVLAITGISSDMDEVGKVKILLKDLSNHRTVLNHMTREAKVEYQNIIRTLNSYSKDI